MNNIHDPVDKLNAFLSVFNGKLTALPERIEYAELGIRHIDISSEEPNIQLIVPVTDEYQEVDTSSHVVLLHLVLQACEYYEEASHYQEWCCDSELPDTPLIKQLYNEMRAITKKLRQVTGHDLGAISDYDVQLNTDIAKKLRYSN